MYSIQGHGLSVRGQVCFPNNIVRAASSQYSLGFPATVVFFKKFAQHAPLPSVSSLLSEKTRYHISLSKRLGLEHVLSQTQRLNVFQITWSPAMLSMKRDGLLLLSSIDYRTGLQHVLPSAPCLPIFPFCSLLNVHFHHKSCPPL